MTKVDPASPVRLAGSAPVDAAGLARTLRRRVRGGVRFDPGTRAMYATDASNYRQVPIGVVVPRTLDDVIATVATCREFGAPVLSRGGGTSLAGECCNVAVVMDFSKHLTAVESFDPDRRRATVQPGLVLDELNKQTGPYHRLIFGPKPSTHDHCTIGGMIGNNSCGSTAQWSGTTAANVCRLEVLTYDGERMWVGPVTDEEYAAILRVGGRRAEIHRRVRELRDRYADRIRAFPRLPRRISGYNLPALLPENGFDLAQALAGTESTCVTVLRAQLRLVPEPAERVLVLMAFPDIATAGDAVPTVNRYRPVALEGLDDKLVRYEGEEHMRPEALRLLPEGGAWLMADFGADTAGEATATIHDMLAELGHDEARIFDDPEHREQMWGVREAGLGATARTPGGGPDTWPGWEDSAVPPDRLGDYLRDFRELLHRYDYDVASLYGHFGDGCLHTSIPFDLVTADGVRAFRSFVDDAADLVGQYGGSYSGEHGDGQARGRLLTRMYGPEVVRAFEEFKAIFDPDNRMNPGKVVHANPIDGQLRLGADYAPAEPATYFRYADDDGSFARAALRCAGVGLCRHHEPGDGVMCPSYQVTRDEQHSTRGRARLLFEMLRGETIDGWHEPAVADALDLCLACKGCKRDCPMHVDMATYKAEFLAHRYHGRIRPVPHYSLGWLPVAARVAACAPGLTNAATHAPVLGALVKRLGGIDPARDVPRFARAGFKRWFRHRTPRGDGARGTVLLWPDTFTTYLAPGIAASAVGALEQLGFRVELPRQQVCCGLTWISTGQLGVARRVLRRTVEVLAPRLRQGVPVVGLEPSCTAVLRSDAADLLGPGQDVQRLKRQTRTFAELLVTDHDVGLPPLTSAGGDRPHAISQAHCHHHAVLGYDADQELLRRAGLDNERLASGCCGLAGDFGMTREHRDVSLAVGEQVLLPAVRAADDTTLVLADGFSCRTQIQEARTGRQPVHTAEVVNAALRGVRVGTLPERQISVRPEVRRGR
ncbi:FAD-binding and (Fe-S)-binding domain-containing protein [Actinoplanes siamensis]|uniref:Dimethylmenaquinone methyltransferase n=1 Tax=Actinoplanes siamensis TaxID=1223317 RepID=A0A919KDM5_9ACTN|nr:FAD-binding and (Fe-S)-binding domain-containing protein [Actinoplanes siamensis]GIF02822.1 dimethylmenaquinone methyltransferase [Actinoplanes siamensis]